MDMYDEVWEIISALDMRGIRIKDLEKYGITQSLFYKTLKHLNIDSKELTGGSGSKFKFKIKNPLPPEEMKERNAKLLNSSLTVKPLDSERSRVLSFNDKSVTKNVY